MESGIIYLYRKTHNKTGLKYIGITKQDPHKYVGSGEYWKSHLEYHGYDISTEILKECMSEIDVKYWGEYYSTLFNVVESSEYANLKPESGYGGSGMLGKTHTQETKDKISKSLENHIVSEETKLKLSSALIGNIAWNKGISGYSIHTQEYKNSLIEKYSGTNNPFYGKEHTNEFKQVQKDRQSVKVECPICGKLGATRIMKRWHFDNCKGIPNHE